MTQTNGRLPELLYSIDPYARSHNAKARFEFTVKRELLAITQRLELSLSPVTRASFFLPVIRRLLGLRI